MSVTAAADGILRIAATAMSYAVKGVTTERGLDAGDFALVAYGGAGPLHAVEVAREIGIRTVIVPVAPGVFSAFGMLFSDLRYDYRAHLIPAARRRAVRRDRACYRDLEQQGRAAIAGASVKPQRIEVKRALDMRYVGQEHAVTVDLPLNVFEKQGPRGDQASFRRRCICGAMARRRRTSAPRSSACASTVTGLMQQAAAGEDQAWQTGRPTSPPSPASGRSISPAASSRRRPTPALRCCAGNRIVGPALIEEHASTTVLMPGDRLEVDAYGNLVITVGTR